MRIDRLLDNDILTSDRFDHITQFLLVTLGGYFIIMDQSLDNLINNKKQIMICKIADQEKMSIAIKHLLISALLYSKYDKSNTAKEIVEVISFRKLSHDTIVVANRLGQIDANYERLQKSYYKDFYPMMEEKGKLLKVNVNQLFDSYIKMYGDKGE